MQELLKILKLKEGQIVGLVFFSWFNATHFLAWLHSTVSLLKYWIWLILREVCCPFLSCTTNIKEKTEHTGLFKHLVSSFFVCILFIALSLILPTNSLKVFKTTNKVQGLTVTFYYTSIREKTLQWNLQVHLRICNL